MKRIALLFLTIVIASTGSASTVLALNEAAYNEQTYSQNLIRTVDPRTTACTESAGSINLMGNDNEEKAWNFFVSKGLTKKQTAGIIGNLQVESGMDPTIKQQGGGPGRGIAQWTVSERWQVMIDWAGNRDIWALDTQLDFIWYELNGTEGAAFTHLKSTSTIEAATISFLTKYERAGVPHTEGRIAAANEAYGRYSGEAAPTTPSEDGDSKTDDPEGNAPSAPLTTPGCSPGGGGSGTIVSVAIGELGVKEEPPECDSGNPSRKGSCGAGVDKYTDGTLEYWCGDFVSWVYKQAGTPFTGGASGGWRYPSVAALTDWFRKNGSYTSNGSSANPSPGDVYFMGTTHTGIVEKVENGTLYTISGNTGAGSTSNGDGVGRATYPNFKSNSAITGFGSL